MDGNEKWPIQNLKQTAPPPQWSLNGWERGRRIRDRNYSTGCHCTWSTVKSPSPVAGVQFKWKSCFVSEEILLYLPLISRRWEVPGTAGNLGWFLWRKESCRIGRAGCRICTILANRFYHRTANTLPQNGFPQGSKIKHSSSFSQPSW